MTEQASEVRAPAEPFGDEQLVVGRRYQVTINDCCAEGSFTGTFVGVRYVEDKLHSGVFDYAHRVVFDTGEIGPMWGQWTATEIANGCTGVTASWCPVHGDCRCDPPTLDSRLCPLHAPTSDHGGS